MTYWNKSTFYGGIYASSLHSEYRNSYTFWQNLDFRRLAEKIAEIKNIVTQYWEKTRNLSLLIKNNLRSHISCKQELYWPIFIAITILLFVFVSKIATAAASGEPNNLPISGNSKSNLIGFQINQPAKTNLASTQDDKSKKASGKTANSDPKESDNNSDAEALKEDISKIVKDTPMADMVDSISEKDRTVAAFIVGIAMKESKFGVYAPHIAGRDCYNYWGLKAGGKTTAGGYTCFSSPDEAVNAVGKTIEKMVAKGVRTPAQAISWKCGSSCAGHGKENVRKWIADVGINFYKINS